MRHPVSPIQSRLTRRFFMQLALSAGLTVAAAKNLWAQESDTTPKKGGKFRMGIGQGATTDSLDPGTFMDYMSGSVCASYASYLTQVDAEGKVQPELAASFEPADAAKKWIFTLRDGVTFSDGRPLTPADVIASIRHHQGEGSTSAVKSLLAPIVNITGDGNNVVFELDAPNADLPYLVSDYHVPIMPAKEDGSLDWQSGIGSGPFTLESYQPGVKAVLKRNPNYYGEAWFDEVEILSIVDAAARMNALASGEIDFADRCDLKSLTLLARNKDLQIDEVAGFAHITFSMDVTQAPFDNPAIRSALKYAIDREDILAKVLSGHGKIGNDNPIAATVPYAIDPQPVHSYDPEKARAILKEAGIDSLKIDLSASEAAFAGAVDAATLFQAHAAKAGIEINVIREANDAFWESVWGVKPFISSYWGGRPVQDLQFTLGYAKGAAWNETKWANPRFNELLATARGELDDAKRAAMYAEMQQLVHDDGGTIVMAFNTYVQAFNKTRIAHGTLAADKELDGARITSRWWAV